MIVHAPIMAENLPYQGPESNLDLSAKLDQPIARNAEERRRRTGVAHEIDEDLVSPQRHAGPIGGDNRLAAQKERGVHHVEAQSLGLATLQRLRNMRILGKAEAHDQPVEIVAERGDLSALAILGG